MSNVLHGGAGIPCHPVGDPVDKLYEWQKAEAKAESHKTSNLDNDEKNNSNFHIYFNDQNTWDMKPTPVILSSLHSKW